MRLLSCALAALGLVALASGCSSEGPRSQACAPGDFVRELLPDGGAGYLQCAADGSGYAPYAGDPNVPVDAGASPTDAGTCVLTENAHLGGFMCVGCTDDSQCAAGLVCFVFTNKGGGHCTRSCTSNADCPLPSAGCGNNGHCKPQ